MGRILRFETLFICVLHVTSYIIVLNKSWFIDRLTMGPCKIFVTFLIVIIAILIYFQIQCWQEEKLNGELFRFEFNAKQMNCQTEFAFAVKDTEKILGIGVTFVLMQFMPCAILKMLCHLQGKFKIIFP